MMVWRLLILLVLVTIGVYTTAQEEAEGPLASIRRQYDSLSPRGKLAAGATVGFVGSRLALNTVTKVVKVGAAAFITYVHISVLLFIN